MGTVKTVGGVLKLINAFKSVRVDLMGGKESKLRGYINYDIQAINGIRDDVANFSKHFGKNTISEITVNNPQSEFLHHVSDALKKGGTIKIRGQMANENFSSIWNKVENGGRIEGFEVISTGQGLSKAGYARSDGTPLRGAENSIREVILRKQ